MRTDPRGRKARPITDVGKEEWWYTCRLFRTNSLKEGAMWCIDPLPGSVLCATMEILLEAVFSMWPTPRLYHSTDRVKLELVGDLVRELEFSHCELLLLEAGS
jgi:hypothetical protein